MTTPSSAPPAAPTAPEPAVQRAADAFGRAIWRRHSWADALGRQDVRVQRRTAGMADIHDRHVSFVRRMLDAAAPPQGGRTGALPIVVGRRVAPSNVAAPLRDVGDAPDGAAGGGEAGGGGRGGGPGALPDAGADASDTPSSPPSLASVASIDAVPAMAHASASAAARSDRAAMPLAAAGPQRVQRVRAAGDGSGPPDYRSAASSATATAAMTTSFAAAFPAPPPAATAARRTAQGTQAVQRRPSAPASLHSEMPASAGADAAVPAQAAVQAPLQAFTTTPAPPTFPDARRLHSAFDAPPSSGIAVSTGAATAGVASGISSSASKMPHDIAAPSVIARAAALPSVSPRAGSGAARVASTTPRAAGIDRMTATRSASAIVAPQPAATASDAGLPFSLADAPSGHGPPSSASTGMPVRRAVAVSPRHAPDVPGVGAQERAPLSGDGGAGIGVDVDSGIRRIGPPGASTGAAQPQSHGADAVGAVVQRAETPSPQVWRKPIAARMFDTAPPGAVASLPSGADGLHDPPAAATANVDIAEHARSASTTVVWRVRQGAPSPQAEPSRATPDLVGNALQRRREPAPDRIAAVPARSAGTFAPFEASPGLSLPLVTPPGVAPAASVASPGPERVDRSPLAPTEPTADRTFGVAPVPGEAAPAATPAAGAASPGIDMEDVVERAVQALLFKLEIERERRGFARWT